MSDFNLCILLCIMLVTKIKSVLFCSVLSRSLELPGAWAAIYIASPSVQVRPVVQRFLQIPGSCLLQQGTHNFL